MVKKLFVLTLAFTMFFTGSIAGIVKAQGEEYEPKNSLVENTNLETSDIESSEVEITPYKLPDPFKAIVIGAIATSVISFFVTNLLSSALNWIKDSFRDNGGETDQCSVVKIGGETIYHTDRSTWIGDGKPNNPKYVKALQKALKNSNYDPGSIDGKWGEKTKKALKKAQYDKGLNADGVVGTKTYARFGGLAEACWK